MNDNLFKSNLFGEIPFEETTFKAFDPFDPGIQRVREGDILVFRCEGRLPIDVARKLRENIAKQLGENTKFIILEAGMHIETVLRPDSDDES